MEERRDRSGQGGGGFMILQLPANDVVWCYFRSWLSSTSANMPWYTSLPPSLSLTPSCSFSKTVLPFLPFFHLLSSSLFMKLIYFTFSYPMLFLIVIIPISFLLPSTDTPPLHVLSSPSAFPVD